MRQVTDVQICECCHRPKQTGWHPAVLRWGKHIQTGTGMSLSASTVKQLCKGCTAVQCMAAASLGLQPLQGIQTSASPCQSTAKSWMQTVFQWLLKLEGSFTVAFRCAAQPCSWVTSGSRRRHVLRARMHDPFVAPSQGSRASLSLHHVVTSSVTVNAKATCVLSV